MNLFRLPAGGLYLDQPRSEILRVVRKSPYKPGDGPGG